LARIKDKWDIRLRKLVAMFPHANSAIGRNDANVLILFA
jgi:hypothetical protein